MAPQALAAHQWTDPHEAAPDGLPMVGPMPGVPERFEAHSFTFGTQGGGAGKAAAGTSHARRNGIGYVGYSIQCRYTDYADHDYCLVQGA
jgi:dimethylglycine dehydrogenase